MLFSIIASYYNIKVPYQKKAILFNLLIGLYPVVNLPFSDALGSFYYPVLVTMLSLGSALGIFALSLKTQKSDADALPKSPGL